MSPKFYIATAQVKDGPLHVFVVTPKGDVIEDKRSTEDIMRSAADKGYECSYCALYTMNIGRYTSEQLRAKIYNVISRQYDDIRSEWDVEIDVTHKILDPGEDARKRQCR